MVMVFEFTSQHPNFPKPNPSFSHNHKFCLVYDLSGFLPTHTPPLPTSTEVPVPHEFQGLGPKDLGPRGVAVAGHVDEIQTHLAVAVPGWDATRLGWVGGVGWENLEKICSGTSSLSLSNFPMQPWLQAACLVCPGIEDTLATVPNCETRFSKEDLTQRHWKIWQPIILSFGR